MVYSKLGIILIQCKTKVIIINKSVYIAVLRTHFVHASKGIKNAIPAMTYHFHCSVVIKNIRVSRVRGGEGGEKEAKERW